jgi:recombination protein RecT
MTQDNGDNKTHIITKENARPSTPIDQFKTELAIKHYKAIENYLNNDKDKAAKFASSVLHCVNRLPALLDCDRNSVFDAFITCAQLNLFPSNAGGEAYILPYKGKAQFQLGYQGLITLLARTGVSITTGVVFEKDIFEYEEGLEPRLVHKPNVMMPDRGAAIGCYAIARLPNGEKQFKVMGAADILKFKEFSQAKASTYSPWNSNDPELWMWRKTVIKQLAKTLSKNEDVNIAIEKDNEESIIAKYQQNASSPAVGAAQHKLVAINELGNE